MISHISMPRTFMAVYYLILWMYHSFFIHRRAFDYLSVPSDMNAAAIKLCVQLREINALSLGCICAISVRCRPLKRTSLNTSIFASLL